MIMAQGQVYIVVKYAILIFVRIVYFTESRL